VNLAASSRSSIFFLVLSVTSCFGWLAYLLLFQSIQTTGTSYILNLNAQLDQILNVRWDELAAVVLFLFIFYHPCEMLAKTGRDHHTSNLSSLYCQHLIGYLHASFQRVPNVRNSVVNVVLNIHSQQVSKILFFFQLSGTVQKNSAAWSSK
jgi:hypothetical protein